MARPNEVVGALLLEFADLLSMTGGQAFKARAYEKAAKAVSGHHADISTLDLKQLEQIPNVGKSTAAKILEYLSTGKIETLEKMRLKMPAGLRALMNIPGLGPQKAVALHSELGIGSVEELTAAIEAGKLEGLRGFGPKTVENILHGIEVMQAGNTGRVLISTAMAVAEEIIADLKQVKGTEKITYAGSLRRMKETIGDVDILAAANDSGPLMERFAKTPLSEVIVKGPAKTSIRTARGLQVDLRVVPAKSWGAALMYFTGSKEHSVSLRTRLVRQGLKLSEYGLFRAEDNELLAAETEEDVYARLGLPWIPPALREDRGELDGDLPMLVQESDLKGDLHTHTNLTDGVAPLARMVEAAAKRGYSYYAITDHAKNLPMQRMTDEKMLRQREEVRALDAGPMTLLHGTELNIDPDGEVDWDHDFLSKFDITVASVHSHFSQPSKVMTQRIIRACENPYVNIIGHLTTRKVLKRPPVDADFDAVFEAAAATGTAIEINAHPDRLDINDDLILRAKRHGVKFSIDSDAHSTGHLNLMRYGIGMAQRGWLTKAEVINTWPLAKLRAFVKSKRKI
ncbi:DNA polymerase/3'-5' exonuclease PolX [Catelliglobosispora koreensis]|uniref:DNA polymerase/3'-5' exonuclease PolX n=1 Tax=Catelliglobosispora koreensis TaxID=129052 RepID=UPI00036917BF|nr:DNA polymerase/3'-5' exonuclease PolX [Catelliglobosispora koreensis]